jgi:pyridine nucleotide-disulfide oxidoreductase family protein
VTNVRGREVTDATHRERRIVLVGAGHTHVRILESWAKSRPGRAALTLVVDSDSAVYSGMVPGFVAGDCSLEETAIPVAPLARRAGATLVLQRAERIHPARKSIELAGGSLVEYDIASLDVGSSVVGLDLPGVREHALATRPIGPFAACLAERLAALGGPDDPRLRSGRSTKSTLRVAVVGGGAAGVELSFTLEARLSSIGVLPEMFLVCGTAGLLPGYSERARRFASKEAAARRIAVAATSDATFVDEHGVGFESGHLAADLVLWATGAAPPEMVRHSDLPLDKRGFVRVKPTLEVAGCDGLFAAGDCATIQGDEWVPKAGVYAVRQGPVLDANLRALLDGRPLAPFEPQRDFLSLMNLGGRRALATKWGLAFSGRLAWHLKDRVDRAFVRRYTVDD